MDHITIEVLKRNLAGATDSSMTADSVECRGTIVRVPTATQLLPLGLSQKYLDLNCKLCLVLAIGRSSFSWGTAVMLIQRALVLVQLLSIVLSSYNRGCVSVGVYYKPRIWVNTHAFGASSHLTASPHALARQRMGLA